MEKIVIIVGDTKISLDSANDNLSQDTSLSTPELPPIPYQESFLLPDEISADWQDEDLQSLDPWAQLPEFLSQEDEYLEDEPVQQSTPLTEAILKAFFENFNNSNTLFPLESTQVKPDPKAPLPEIPQEEDTVASLPACKFFVPSSSTIKEEGATIPASWNSNSVPDFDACLNFHIMEKQQTNFMAACPFAGSSFEGCDQYKVATDITPIRAIHLTAKSDEEPENVYLVASLTRVGRSIPAIQLDIVSDDDELDGEQLYNFMSLPFDSQSESVANSSVFDLIFFNEARPELFLITEEDSVLPILDASFTYEEYLANPETYQDEIDQLLQLAVQGFAEVVDIDPNTQLVNTKIDLIKPSFLKSIIHQEVF